MLFAPLRQLLFPSAQRRLPLSVRRVFLINRDRVLHRRALAREIFGDCGAQSLVGESMQRMGWHRAIAARQLVFALRARFDALQAARNGEIDRLVVADLEMQKWMLLDRAPIA